MDGLSAEGTTALQGLENGATVSEVSPTTTSVGNRKQGKHKIKIPGFVKRGMKSPKADTNTVDAASPTVLFSFEENLRQKRLCEASQQLIAREDHLFGRGEAREHANGECGESEEDELQRDYEALLVQVWLAVEASLGAGPGERETLRSAALCILQEEEQDRRWQEEPGAELPLWRPRHCRRNHDDLLRKVVEERMDNAEDPNGAEKLATPLKKEICKLGKQVKEDLLKVAREVKACYPEEFGVCKVYAWLYHQAFSGRLAKMAKPDLDINDTSYLLGWVYTYYPKEVLKHKELEKDIDGEALGPLLPEDVLCPLEDQYLSHKESQVKEWMSKALRKEEDEWRGGSLPELIMDQYYFSAIAIDVIQAVDGVLKEAVTILGDISKAQRIICQLETFFISYRRTFEEFMKGKRRNTEAVIKANLASIEQFKEFVEKLGDTLPKDTKKNCQSILSSMEDIAYGYFSNIIHENLKTQYRQLGTAAWLSGGFQAVDELERHIQDCQELKPTCKQELVSRIHTQVMVEYVKRLMKRKLKLKDREQQEAAASLLCEDSRRLRTVFTDAGSEEVWLHEILPKIAEVLKLQDPGAIQLEVVTLARDYPDLSKDHISALLHLKSNLSSAQIKRINQSLVENRGSVGSLGTHSFFSSIHVKWTTKIM
ncbi:hypothetical protein MATL_G00208790 [Megalops atlanticus]|uniref:Tumor necrosis factor alpha-induced protein 2 n=1 Tax=Megalops atlanticus TaxID=7932 RepID=A0A9D3PKP3_MEGAT|nr:hypothetical protein MATL_G00208790 [Megalops atlanticus]